MSKFKSFLRERDYRLFDLLYRFKVATVEDIQEMIWKGKCKTNIYRRLKELNFLGYIQKIPYLREGHSLSTYSLTKKSFSLVWGGEKESKGHRVQFLSDKVEHDLALLRIYKRLIRSSQISDFFTENILLSNSSEVRSLGIEVWIKNHPDAILVDESLRKPCFLPLECELSVKKKFRYESKLITYYQSKEIPAVLYVCGDSKVQEVISRIEQSYCQRYRQKVFYGFLEQFYGDSNALIFTNREGGQLRF